MSTDKDTYIYAVSKKKSSRPNDYIDGASNRQKDIKLQLDPVSYSSQIMTDSMITPTLSYDSGNNKYTNLNDIDNTDTGISRNDFPLLPARQLSQQTFEDDYK
uniref:Uncharacterized protein n=1 Tax=Arion vulgaris TaxID=1028688 RepID=A0A0B7AA52_9EUPU